MEPIVSTSFIPKRPVSTEPVRTAHSSAAVGLLSLITFIVVIGTGAAFAGVYFYQQSLVSQKAKLQAQITQAQEGLGTSFVTDMKRLSNRIAGVRTVIENHVVVSPIFAALQATTLQSVQYKSFSYTFTTDTGTSAKLIQVNITGVARNYATLALQSDAFAKSSLIRNPVFSNLTVEDKTQQVAFKLTFTVNSSDLSYQTFINSLTPTLDQLPASTMTQ
ncbi:MAG: hypothetical protein V4478_03885 [Patescibacteria group bacterium]